MHIQTDADGKPLFRKLRKRFDHLSQPRELTFSSYRGHQFFLKRRPCEWFVESLEEGLHQGNVDLWCWVIMPEHVHLIVSPRDPLLEVGTWIGRIKQMFRAKLLRGLNQRLLTGWSISL
ncbi:hypothetical protein Plim_2831 [Planctopirus limnophila DSM 3776]|uniref:Transposase IS200-like domain-containing protein n=1 Tax=Planctopirus limnophila (strain ATCC 43296 / DSM 3776 / IFAM 1008 / Mu 290) TaxID=521674 RepID=D5SRG0_PLAL2|nr:hypothetical protein Plim_2831 [Planctopirus limnophila DSM 3776]